ncbi:MAG: response regulator transcription factor [Proteobacteria bacterium]|nr:response regulator transcription factor [Pseudomonadota bacterium]
MAKKIIMVDDPALCELTCDYLQRFDFEIVAVHRPSQALKKIAEQHFAAAIIDVMMPEMDGFELVRQIRSSGSKLPLLMLSARGEVTDRVVGLETGADDYLAKPFEPRELAARLTALCRRPTLASSNATLNFAGLRFSFATQQVKIYNDNCWQEVFLTSGEFRALAVLIEARPAVVSRDELSARLHGLEFDFADRSLDITISRVRQKLGDNAQKPCFIKTVRNTGYAFIAAASDHTAPAIT